MPSGRIPPRVVGNIEVMEDRRDGSVSSSRARTAASGQDPRRGLRGLARRFGMGATMMRILFVVTLIVIPGSQILVYPILWILMPSE